MDGFIDNDENLTSFFSSKKHTNLKTRVQKP